MNHDFPQDLQHAKSKLYAFVRRITSKEIHISRISWGCREIAEIFYMFEEELLASFMDLRDHLLIHLVDEVELVGVISCHWMFFLESYIKKI